jgi:hypothetical protein
LRRGDGDAQRAVDVAGLATYVAAVAPSMSTQFVPLVSQRRHW